MLAVLLVRVTALLTPSPVSVNNLILSIPLFVLSAAHVSKSVNSVQSASNNLGEREMETVKLTIDNKVVEVEKVQPSTKQPKS